MQSDLIVSDPSVMMGKAVVSGTRITVESILEKLAAGESKQQIVAEHPRLSEESILAALSFASRALRADVIYPITAEAGQVSRFLADEGVEYQVVERLREDGHEVDYVAEMEPGISDDEVLDSANRDGALLLTADRDFGELVFRQRRLHAGVILIRLSGLSTRVKADAVVTAIREHAEEYRGSFAVVTPGAVRLRRSAS